jgi:hypothetical protein
LNLIYRPREDLIKGIKAAEKEVLKKIRDLESYRGNCILLDLDQENILFSDRDRQKVIEYYLNHESDNEHRTTITRLTEEYLADLK